MPHRCRGAPLKLCLVGILFGSSLGELNELVTDDITTCGRTVGTLSPGTQRSSRLDFNRSAGADQFPNLVHLFVRHRNASVSPVMQSVCLSHESVILREAVQH